MPGGLYGYASARRRGRMAMDENAQDFEYEQDPTVAPGAPDPLPKTEAQDVAEPAPTEPAPAAPAQPEERDQETASDPIQPIARYVAQRAQRAQQTASAEPSPLAQYASRTRAPKVPEPPMQEDENKVGLLVAAGLSFLTGGQDLPMIVQRLTEGNDGTAMENYSRTVKAMKDQAEIDARYANAGMRNYAYGRDGLAADRLRLQRDREQRLAELAKSRMDPSSDLNNGIRSKLYQTGNYPEGSLDGATYDALNKLYVKEFGRQAELSAGDEIAQFEGKKARARGDESVETARKKLPIDVSRAGQISDATQANKRELVDLATSNRVGAEVREEARQIASTEIPGWEIKEGYRPSTKAAETAREIADALDEVVYAADELKKLHDELGATAKLGRMSSLFGTDKEATLIARAKLLHQKLLTSERKLQNMGVPQQYELQMLQEAEPELSTLDGVLRAGVIYGTVRDEAKAQAIRRMEKYDYVPVGSQKRAPANPDVVPDENGAYGGKVNTMRGKPKGRVPHPSPDKPLSESDFEGF